MKNSAKFPTPTPGFSMVKIARLGHTFLASLVEGQSLQQKGKKKRKRTGQKKIKISESLKM